MIPMGRGLIALHTVLDVEPPEIRTNLVSIWAFAPYNHQTALNGLNGGCSESSCANVTSSFTAPAISATNHHTVTGV